MNNNQQAFFALVRAGLWEEDLRLSTFGVIDYQEVYRLAEEQSVVGLVAAGFEHIADVKAPQEVVLQFVGTALQLEQHNTAMNKFISVMMDKMKEAGVEPVLIKGQGVAQCYERPLWRSGGDVDLLLNEENYEKGKKFLVSITDYKPKEYSFNKEFITSVQGWCLELHGSLRCGLSASMNRGVDEIQQEICDNHHVRFWEINETRIPLPEENLDVLMIFTHFIKHFYKGGLGIRQLCDWCRLMWRYKDSLNNGLLESRIMKMGLMTEWKAFAAYSVAFLGMPAEAMPLYDNTSKWKKKANRIHSFIIRVGNFGHNVDGSYYLKYPFIIRKTISMWRRTKTLFCHSSIFPLQTLRYFPHIIYTGLGSAFKGE